MLTYFFNPMEGPPGAWPHAKVAGLDIRALVARPEEGPKPQPDDVTLARKVETEIFRDAEVPKGQINVNAENGKVYLRGEVGEPEMIRDLEERTRNIHGVQEVENLLHMPGGRSPHAPGLPVFGSCGRFA